MAWIGKIAGIVLGGLLGASVGWVIPGVYAGLLLGFFLDLSIEERRSIRLRELLGAVNTGIPLSLDEERDPLGIALRFQLGEATATKRVVRVRFLNLRGDRYLQAVSDSWMERSEWLASYRDGDGDFLLEAPFDFRGKASLYLPFCALELPRSGHYLMEATVFESARSGLSPAGQLGVPLLLMQRPCPLAEFWRPLAGLLMAVALAGGDLSREEVSFIRRALEERIGIPTTEREALRSILKEEPSATPEEMASLLGRRVPGQGSRFVELLAELAALGGGASPEQEEILERVAPYLGSARRRSGRWRSEQRGSPRSRSRREESHRQEQGQRGRTSPPPGGPGPRASRELRAARELLGVGPGATRREIQRAFHAKVSQYHPDRFQHLSAEFQELARTKTIELTRARDLLLAELERGGGARAQSSQ